MMSNACDELARMGGACWNVHLIHAEVPDLVLQRSDADVQQLRRFRAISPCQCECPGNGRFFGALLEPADFLLQVAGLRFGLGRARTACRRGTARREAVLPQLPEGLRLVANDQVAAKGSGFNSLGDLRICSCNHAHVSLRW